MRLFSDFISRYGEAAQLWQRDNFAANYLVLDVETTGFDYSKNRITQIGCLVVQNGKPTSPTDSKSWYVKTKYDPITWSAAYAGIADVTSKSRRLVTMLRKANCDLEMCKRAIDENDGSIQGLDCIPLDIQNMLAPNGNMLFITPVDVTHIRSKQCEELGFDRSEIVSKFSSLIKSVLAKGWFIVGHNLVALDIPYIIYEAKHFAGIDLEINMEQVIDTGLLVKGDQLNSKITKKMTNAEYYKKMEARRSKKVKWALDDFCVPHFKLDDKYGVDTTQQHKSAGYDCWVNDCLLREML